MVSLMNQEISTLPGYLLSLPICIGVCFFCFAFVFVLMNCLCICIIHLLKKPFGLLYSEFFSIVNVQYVLIDWLINWSLLNVSQQYFNYTQDENTIYIHDTVQNPQRGKIYAKINWPWLVCSNCCTTPP
jgi:hypothetical protein